MKSSLICFNCRQIPDESLFGRVNLATPALLMLQPLPFALGMFHWENDPKNRPNNPRTIKICCRTFTHIPIYRWFNRFKFPSKHNLDLFLLFKSYEITIFDRFSWYNPNKPTIFSPFSWRNLPGRGPSGPPKDVGRWQLQLRHLAAIVRAPGGQHHLRWRRRDHQHSVLWISKKYVNHRKCMCVNIYIYI